MTRTEIGQVKAQMAGFVTRDLANEIVILILQRIGKYEALMEARFDQLSARLSGPGEA